MNNRSGRYDMVGTTAYDVVDGVLEDTEPAGAGFDDAFSHGDRGGL